MSYVEQIAGLRMEPPYTYISGNFLTEKSLTPPGLEVARKKQEDAIDYEGIDIGIRRIIKNLNDLPFIATHACCQGHLYNKADKVILAGDEVFLWGGTLYYLFDPRVPGCEQFFNRLETLSRSFQFVYIDFTEPQRDYFVYPSAECFGLPGCSIAFDLGEYYDSAIFVSPYKGAVVKREDGDRRTVLYAQFWKELSDVATQMVSPKE